MYKLFQKKIRLYIMQHAVTVSNFILGLVNNGVKYLKDCGFSEEMAMKALYPLIEFNLKNIKENGIMKSLNRTC